MAETKTPAEKAAETRRRHKEARRLKQENQERTIAALEKVIQDNGSSREARENALFLLRKIYTR